MSASTFFYIITTLFVLLALLSSIAAYQFGYSRGSRSFVDEPPTPMAVEEDMPETITFSVGYLEPTTGPVDIVAGIIQVESSLATLDTERIAALEARVAHERRLKLTYYRLLKDERAMMKQVIQGGGVQLTSYWRRWVRDQFAHEAPFWLSQSWSRIANISRAGH